MSKNLDKLDRKLLSLLCKNARLSNNSIGKTLNLNANVINYRINRLIQKGIIIGFSTIVNQQPLKIANYEVFIKINANQEEIALFEDFIIKNRHVMVADRLIGEWDYILEIGCSDIFVFMETMEHLSSKFSHIIDKYEVHIVQKPFKVEQLPIELKDEINPEINEGFTNVESTYKPDEIDKKILHELNINTRIPLNELATKLGYKYETISSRIKKLQKQKVILRFTANISVFKLGYEMYVLTIPLRNLSKEQEKKIKNYITIQKKVRYAFLSGSKPEIILYYAAKDSLELGEFMRNLQNNFNETIFDMRYMLSTTQLKYNLFPEGLVE